MKKLSFILAAFLVCGAMQAQISFDFEDGTLQGWTTIDADGQRIGTLGFRWSVTIVFSGPYHWQPFDT